MNEKKSVKQIYKNQKKIVSSDRSSCSFCVSAVQGREADSPLRVSLGLESGVSEGESTSGLSLWVELASVWMWTLVHRAHLQLREPPAFLGLWSPPP